MIVFYYYNEPFMALLLLCFGEMNELDKKYFCTTTEQSEGNKSDKNLYEEGTI